MSNAIPTSGFHNLNCLRLLVMSSLGCSLSHSISLSSSLISCLTHSAAARASACVRRASTWLAPIKGQSDRRRLDRRYCPALGRQFLLFCSRTCVSDSLTLIFRSFLSSSSSSSSSSRDSPGQLQKCTKNAQGGARIKQEKETYLLNGSRLLGQAGTTTKIH